MPEIRVDFFEERNGIVPIHVWLDGLPVKARDRCLARLKRLRKFGHDLRRPDSAPLGDGLHELRVKFYRVNYRMIYFFDGRGAAVVCHGLAKESVVPKRDLRIAAERMALFRSEPAAHTFHPRK